MTSWGIPVLNYVRRLFFAAKTFLQQHRYLALLLTFTFFFIVFCKMYFSVLTLASGDDHFFHFRFAELIREKGFQEAFFNFKSIYFSKMASNQYFVYYNFLFYIVLLPFTYIQPLFLAIKLYAVVSAALAFTIFYGCCRRLGVMYPFLWTVALCAITGTSSLWRFFLSRPYTLAPAILILLLYFLHRKKYVGVFIISFLYLYWHSVTFFFPLAVAITYLIFQRFYKEKGDWKNIWSALLGTGVAVILVYLFTPGFFVFVKDVVLDIPFVGKLGGHVSIPEGGEVYPSQIFDYIRSNIILFSLLILAVVIEINEYIEYRSSLSSVSSSTPHQVLRATTFFISIGFFAGTVLVSSRFNDYFIFIAGLYFTLVFSSLFSQVTFTTVRLRRGFFAGLIVVVIYLFSTNVIALQNAIASNGAPAQTFEGVGSWLNENTKKGSVVFDANWSWFAQLYYYSPDNNYVAGIEPRFLYIYDSKLYWLWSNIARYGFICDTELCSDTKASADKMLRNNKTAAVWFKAQGDAMATVLLTRFNSQYIVTSYQYPALNNVLNHNTHFEKVYGSDRAYYIYKVTP